MYDIIVGRKKQDTARLGTKGTVLMGRQYVKMGEMTSLANNVYLDVTQSHVVFICGKRGSGKSYAMGAMAEGIMDLDPEIGKNISMILLDTMGVYWTMKYANKTDKEILEKWGLAGRGLAVNIFTPVGSFQKYKDAGVPTDFPFSIQPSELDADQWCLTFEVERNSELGVLIEKIITVLKEEKETFSIEEMIEAVDKETAPEYIKAAAKNRFINVKSWGLFDKQGTKIKDLVRGGTITVLDLSAYATEPNGWAIKSIVVGILAQKLFTERMKSRRQEEFDLIKTEQEYYHKPSAQEKREPLVWLAIDEAHEFLPFEGKTSALPGLLTILREGRQPGISLILATQQPGKIHTDVMTQSDIILSLRLTAKIDTDALGLLLQSYMRKGIDKYVENLPRVPGAAIILDDENERIYPIQVRPRITWHGGAAPTALPPEGHEIKGMK